MFDGADTSVTPLLLSPQDWPHFAERLQPHLAKMAAGSGGRYEAQDIEAEVRTGRMQIWLVLEGASILCAMMTQLVVYPRSRALRCIGIVGHRPRKWMPLLARVEECARRHMGCDRMECLHQSGHERLLRTGGWAAWHMLSEKIL